MADKELSDFTIKELSSLRKDVIISLVSKSRLSESACSATISQPNSLDSIATFTLAELKVSIQEAVAEAFVPYLKKLELL